MSSELKQTCGHYSKFNEQREQKQASFYPIHVKTSLAVSKTERLIARWRFFWARTAHTAYTCTALILRSRRDAPMHCDARHPFIKFVTFRFITIQSQGSAVALRGDKRRRMRADGSGKSVARFFLFLRDGINPSASDTYTSSFYACSFPRLVPVHA